MQELLDELSDQDSDEFKLYSEVKAGGKKLDVLLKKDLQPVMFHFLDAKHEPVSINMHDLDQIVAIVKEEMLASPSQNPRWKKVNKKANQLGLPYSNSKSFHDLVMKRLSVKQEAPVQSANHDDVKQFHKTFGTELGQFQMQKRFSQNERRHLNKLKRNLTDQVLFRQQIEEAIATPIKVHEKPAKIDLAKTDPETDVIVISDWHIGATVNITSNQYSLLIAKQRLRTLYEKAVKYLAKHRPERCLIVNLGDLIEGAQMRYNQAYTIDLSLGQQITEAGQLQTNFVRDLANVFPKINFSFTELEGNHDRFAPNKKNELPQDGISMVARELLREASKDTKNLQVIEPADEYRYLANLRGHNLMFVHGDRDKLAEKDILGKLSTFVRRPIDVLVGGHLHSIQIREQGNDQFVCQSGSLIGPSDYSNSLGIVSSPSQLFISVTNDEIVPQIVLL